MSGLIHTGLRSSSLIAHVLHSPPPPPREQLCNRSCSNKHTQNKARDLERLDGREGKHQQTQVLTQGARERARRLSRLRVQERLHDRQYNRERGEAGLSRPEGERLPHLSSLCSSLLCSIPSRLPSARASRVKPSRQLQKLPRGNPIAADAEGMQQRARHVALLHAAVRHRQDYSRAGAGRPSERFAK